MRKASALAVLAAPFLAAAVPLLRPWPPGAIMREVSAPLPRGGAFTVVASREPRGSRFQYYLSIYAAWPGAAWHRVFLAPDGSRPVIPRVTQGHGTTRFFPDQTLTLLGTVPMKPGAAALAVAEMHNAGADCGEGTVMLLGQKSGRRFGLVLTLSNPCALSARIEGDHIQLSGPYYAKSAPLYKPTIAHARAILRYRHGRFTETPDYFKLASPQ
ncbi:MAG TPA: hypothetical protein VFN77_04910 [Acetobacteraceae bacterium]|nr:hypothetical protein [Acetobacteraceae bacterium]